MKVDEKTVIEGYLYPCGGIECRGIIIFPRKITMKDFSKTIQWFMEDTDAAFVKYVKMKVKVLQEGLKDNFLPCSIITPCSEDERHGLGKEAIELVEFLDRFKGKKVKITIEVVKDERRN